ncbi:MAG: MFS transporter [Candidatus Edwardsbacteria bacterium]|nr:MFS transporter [Candidatus Edwardsbacteria bacterium]
MADQKTPSLWNRNFLLLWQGQLVSSLGDNFYAIALGFWVLEKTGSTGLMGTLMAVSTLPRVLISPFAGVWVDRTERRSLLIAMDVIRGVASAGIGLAAFAGHLEIWMVFAAGIVLSVCGSFFGPAVSSAIPDIVPPEQIVQANSVFSLAYNGSSIIGTAGGGFLYQALKAPLMFLFDGFSYVFSAAAILFMKIPAVRHQSQKLSFFQDMKGGLLFVKRFKGLRYSFLIFGVLNFFANIGFFLILPMFQKISFLGAGKYGIVMGVLTGGSFLGYLLASTIKIPTAKRFLVFYLGALMSAACMALFPAHVTMIYMSAMAALIGLSIAVVNALISAVMQITVPQDMRGKVFGLLGTMAGSLTPIAFAVGGWLGEVFPIRPLMSGCFILTFGAFFVLVFVPSVIRFFNFDPSKQTLEEIM